MSDPLLKIVGDNLIRLMKHRTKLGTTMQVQKATELLGVKVGKSTVDRARKGETPLNLEYVESLAAAFGIEPWQLLVENLDPKNLPKIGAVGKAQAALLSEIADLARRIEAMEPKGDDNGKPRGPSEKPHRDAA